MEEWSFGGCSIGAKGGGASGSLGRVKTESKEGALGSRAPHFIKSSRALHLSWQVGVFLVGSAVVFAGVLMLALPGPGWLVIFSGLAIWATEFVWAQLVLRWTRRKVSEAAKRALDPKVRRRNMLITALGLAVAAALIGVYLARYGLEVPWEVAG
ncbi:TIGR02611 family protein [Streptomyces desertarenae]|uniref:TIGR02611 family protein n=1 Tax=Streptomyces desertarenae TaxID=2666184 RepID=A0ABW4PME4_9ACTN